MMDLVLLHGRTDPDQTMDDWGFDGPVIEGIAYVHWTYGNPTVGFVSVAALETAQRLTGWNVWDEQVLEVTMDGDMIAAGGRFYGDWELQAPGYRKTKGEGK